MIVVGERRFFLTYTNPRGEVDKEFTITEEQYRAMDDNYSGAKLYATADTGLIVSGEKQYRSYVID